MKVTAEFNALVREVIAEYRARAVPSDIAAAAPVVLPEWEKVRRGLTMVMLGFAGRPDFSESAAEAALDAVTEPGMPLAGLRALPATGGQAQACIDWDELPEDSGERAMFDRNLDLYGGDPRLAIATALEIWAKTHGNGSFGLMCAIYANEVAKLHVTPQAQADAQDDSALLDAMERQRIAVVPEYEGPWDAEVYNGDEKPNHRGSGSTPREAIRAAIAASKE